MSYSEEEIRGIWEGQLRIAKQRLKEGRLTIKDGRYPEMWPGYNDAITQRRDLLPHIAVGASADHLFAQRSPNMNAEELAYLLANFKQTTLPVFTDLSNTVQRGMSDGNWSIDYADDGFREYVEGGVREWGSVWSFFKNAFLRIKLSDAMGVIAVLPESIMVKENEDGSMSLAELVAPGPVYYDSSMVWGFEYDRWYIIRARNSTRINNGSKDGVICLFVDDTNVWSIKQTGRDSDLEFVIAMEYAHNCGEAPVIHNRGDVSATDGHVVWQSPYMAAKDCLDLSLMDANMLQATKNKLMYPIPVVVGTTCTYEAHDTRCMEGRIRWTDADGLYHDDVCAGCGGTGRQSSLSPLKELVVTPVTSATQEATGINANSALSYVGPETASATFMRTEADGYEQRARKILHIDAEAPMAGGDVKTATQSGLDAKARDAFVKPIIDQTFEVFSFTLKCIAKQRGMSEDAFALSKPTTYDLRSAEEFMIEAQDAQEKGMPQPVVDDLVEQWVSVKYRDDEPGLAMFRAISLADRLAGMPWERVTALRAAGQVQPWEAYLHDSARHIYIKMVNTVAGFEAKEAKEQARLMVEEAQRTTDSGRTTMLSGAGDIGNAAISIANSTSTDAVSNTALNGAQVSSLLEIINQVSVGAMSTASARPLIHAAFPGIEDRLVEDMLAGVKPVDVSLVTQV